MLLFKIFYWIGMIAELIIRIPFAISKKSQIVLQKTNDKRENILLGLLSLTMLPPLVYSVSNRLTSFNYALPDWLGWLGLGILLISVLIFWRSHYDLKGNWSATLEIYQEQKLITDGIYKFIRHPMYLSQFLSSITQILILQNWIAGPIRLIFFLPFYLLRKENEERMLEERFGQQYLHYKEQTGSLFPKFIK
jgi:protein-S-isoprenylcysteine O-methyltransferase Ste14